MKELKVEEKVRKYLPKGITDLEIVDFVFHNYEQMVSKIKFVNAGWDSFFGEYLLVQAGTHRVVVTKNGCQEYTKFAKERLA